MGLVSTVKRLHPEFDVTSPLGLTSGTAIPILLDYIHQGKANILSPVSYVKKPEQHKYRYVLAHYTGFFGRMYVLKMWGDESSGTGISLQK